VLLLLALALLHTPPVQRYAFKQLRTVLLEKSKIDIQTTGFRFSLFRMDAAVEGLTVRAAEAPDLPPLFRADAVYARPQIGRIAKGFLDFRELRLTAPKIHYYVGADGKSNVPGGGEGGGKIPDYWIAQADIRGGAFQYEDVPRQINLALPQWNLSLAGEKLTRAHTLNFASLQASSFSYENFRLPIDRIVLRGKLKRADLELESAQVSAMQAQLSLQGAIENFGSPVFNLRLNPTLDLSALARAAGWSGPLIGSLSGTIQASGKISDLQIETALQGADIRFGAYRDTRFDLEASARLEPERLRIQNMELRSPHGSLRGNAEVPLHSAGASLFNAKIRDFDLFPFLQLIDSPILLASRSSGDISLRWTGPFSPSALSGSANLAFASTRTAPGANILPLSGTLSAQMQTGRMQATAHSLEALGGRIRGPFTLRAFKEIEGDFELDAADVDAVIAQVSQFLGDSGHPLEGMRISGPIQGTAQVSGRLTQPAIAFSASAPQLKAGMLQHLGARMQGTLEGTQLAFQSAIALPHNATLSAKGILELGGKEPLLTLDAYADPVPAAAIPALLDNDILVSGNLKTELHLSGAPDSLNGSLSVRGEDLTLYEEWLGHLDLDLRMDGKEIRSTRFNLIRNALQTDSDRIDGTLSYELESGHFQFEVKGRDLNWSRAVFQDGGSIQSILNMTASGAGTPERPAIDLKIETGDLRVREKSLGPVVVDAKLHDRSLTLETAAPRFNLISTARMAVEEPHIFNGEARLDKTDLSRLELTAANGQPLTGMLEAAIQASGNLKDLSQSVATAQIHALQLKAGEHEVHTRAPVLVEYRNNVLEIPSAEFVSGNSALALAGRLPLRQPAPTGALSLTGKIDLSQAAGFLSVPEGFAAQGMVDLKLFLAGSSQKLNGSGTITMAGGSARLPGVDTPLTDIAIRASVQGDTLILQQADAAWGPGRIALTGDFPFGLLPKNLPAQIPRKEGPARFSLDMTNIRPEASGRLPQGMSGLISLHASGEAAGLTLRDLSGTIDFRDLSFKMNELSLGQNQPSQITVRNGVASISKLSLSGTETGIEVNGSADLAADGRLDLRLRGSVNAALLTFKNRDLKTAGKINVALVVSGNRNAPGFWGLAEMNGGRLTLRDPRIVADSLSVRLALDTKQISVREFKGNVNGGPMEASGTLRLERDGLRDVDLKATVQDFFLDFPEGLKSSSSGTLSITSVEEDIEIGGTIRVQESAFRESFDVSGRLMNYLRSQQVVALDREPSPMLDRIRLNVAVRTIAPMMVQNNAARLEGSANLRLVGPVQEPSVIGRITLSDGGEIILNQRTYYINRGVVNFSNQARIEPQLDIQAQTEVKTRYENIDITLRLTGTPDKLTTTLTSDPPKSEADIISLLLTGKTREETRGQAMQIAQSQALSLLAGQAGEELTSEARRALGLTTFRIDPGQITSKSDQVGQIASESDQGARLTVGEDITTRLSLIYSMNLTNGGDQIWAAQYSIARRFTTQATKQQDNTYRFEFNHNLQLGGASGERRTRRSAAQRFEIGSIRFEGVDASSEKVLRDRFRIKTGQKYDYPKIQKGMDRLNSFYHDQGRLEASVRMQRDTRDTAIDLSLNVDPGPVVAFIYEGMTLPAGVAEDVEKAWRDGVFDVERLEDSVRAIRLPLLQAGFYRSKVDYGVEMEDGRKTVRFTINPGERYAKVPIVFSGNSGIGAEELRRALDQAGLRPDVFADPGKVSDFITRYYRDRGYLQARAQSPLPQLDPKTGTGQVSIEIEEGPLFLIGELQFNGNRAFSYDELWAAVPTSSGSIYNPDSLRDSVKALESLYQSRGYNDVSVTFRVFQNLAEARADLIFTIVERRQAVIRDIVIEGMQSTSRDFIERQLDFQTGDVLNFARIDESRRRLYSTAVYSTVDFQTEELPLKSADAKIKEVRVRLRVREIRPYRLQYGLFFDTERGMGGILEAENRNFFGQAADVGMKVRYDSDLKEGRVFFYQPFVTKIHIKTDASAFIQRETRTAFSATRVGFSLFQERSLPRKYRLDYGYRYDHVRWKEGEIPPDPVNFQADVPVARLIATLTRDTRDSVLDATRGEFSSHSIEFGPRWLGSEIGFARYYGQYFRYVPLDKFIWKPSKEKDRKAEPARLVYAGALRLGLTSAFGGKSIISPERFFAGGGTTIRGFEQDRLGPLETLKDGTQRPFGGEAMLLFNNEIRFPIFGMLHGAGFLDIGNVYPRISDFNFNVRKSAGFGLRLKIKFIPLRFDYGFILDRKRGEDRGAYFFSIGQAF
jgi:outer membrane protein assembly complex protein YaeT